MVVFKHLFDLVQLRYSEGSGRVQERVGNLALVLNALFAPQEIDP